MSERARPDPKGHGRLGALDPSPLETTEATNCFGFGARYILRVDELSQLENQYGLINDNSYDFRT